MNGLQLRRATAAETTDVRRAALRPGWASGTPMPGDDDPAAVHVAALEGGIVVGACVLLPNGYPADLPAAALDQLGTPLDDAAVWQLRGMATADGQRGRGVGSALLGAALDEVAALGAALVWCEARTVAMNLYARAGFHVDGPEYIVPVIDIPHHRMWRVLQPATRIG